MNKMNEENTYKLTTLSELKDKLKLVPETKLTKQYTEKEFNKGVSLESKLKFHDNGNIGKRFTSPKLISMDSLDNYHLAVFNICHDPNYVYDGGRKGCAYSSQIQLAVNSGDNLERKVIKTFNYRKTGNSPLDTNIDFEEGKILDETNDAVLYGIKSSDRLKFYNFNKKTNKTDLVESVDLAKIRNNNIQIENFDKAFKELDTRAIKDFIDEKNYFRSVVKINDDYALAILEDPYGDTGRRNAKAKLIVKDKGIIDLNKQYANFPVKTTTHSFELEDIELKVGNDKNLVLNYSIAEKASYFNGGGGFNSPTLGKTHYSIKLDMKKINSEYKTEK